MSNGDTNQSGASKMTPALFREVQRFRQWFLYVPIAVVTGVVWWEFIQQIVLGRTVGDEPIPDWMAWALTIVFGLGFPAFAAMVRLVTEVRPGELVVRLFPFRAKRIPTAEIASAETREYSPMREYGGWGVRVSRGSGRAYNAAGTQGVQLVLADGSRVMIGSQQPEQLLAAIRAAGA
jgi:hypothetical protein